jgi:hypothetical protein
MGVMLGGEKAWKVRNKGDFSVSFQWVNEEPAMILFPNKPGVGLGAFVLCLSALHNYVNSDGYPNTPYLVKQSMAAAKQMGFSGLGYEAKKIADAILDSAEDLISMPPEPVGINEKQLQESVGEAIIKVDGQTIFHNEVFVPDDVSGVKRH